MLWAESVTKIPFLRVKIKSLADEARIIRVEERKRRGRGQYPSSTFFELRSHRRGIVRREARASLLAYGFLRGRPYKVIEQKTHERLDKSLMEKIAKMVERFSDEDPRIVAQRFAEWKEAI